MGQPQHLDTAPERDAGIRARIDRLTVKDIAAEIAAHFPPDRADLTGASVSGLHRRVPLAKPWRAAGFAAQSKGPAEIARTLRVSDTSVRKWLK